MANVDIKISGENLLDWSNMEDWVNGTSVAPTNHTLTGGSAAVAREATIIKVGTYSAKVTRAGANATLYYDHPDFAAYQGRKVTFGCWGSASVASRARIAISDGVGSTNSSLHTGGGEFEFLEVTHNMNVSATRMRVEMQVNTGDTVAYFDNGILCQGDSTLLILTDNMDIGDWKTVNRYRSQTYSVPRREGSKTPNSRIESKILNVSGMVIGTTPTTKRTALDTVLKVLNSFRTKPNGDIEMKNLYFYDDRYYKCLVESADPTERAAARIVDLKLRFKIPEPFLWSVNKTRHNEPLSGTTSFTVTNAGTAISRPVIAVTNDSSNITSVIIENLTTGQKVSYSGTLVTGDDLVIDTDALTVKNDGVDDLGNVTNEIGLVLWPGDNEFKITGVVAGDVDVDWFDRWY